MINLKKSIIIAALINQMMKKPFWRADVNQINYKDIKMGTKNIIIRQIKFVKT